MDRFQTDTGMESNLKETEKIIVLRNGGNLRHKKMIFQKTLK